MGLVVPSVRRGRRGSVSAASFASPSTTSAGRARHRKKKITVDDLSGADVSPSRTPASKGNLFGRRDSSNQPNVGILRMGEIKKARGWGRRGTRP